MPDVLRGIELPRRYNFFDAGQPSEPTDEKEPVEEFAAGPLTSAALREAIDVQLKTLVSIERTERAMNTAEKLGEASKQQLAQDKEIIEVIDTSLAANETVLSQVRRDVHWFRMQLQKDKLLLFLFGIVVLMSVAAIIVAIVKHRG